MYIQDLSIYEYRLPFPLQGVRCVGWLDSQREYEIGRSPRWLAEKLEMIIRYRSSTFDAHVNAVRGIHPCNLCGMDVELVSNGEKTLLGMSEIWLPSDPGWIGTPSLIIHYIKSHGYLPPLALVQAVWELSTENCFLGQEVYDRLVAERMGG